MKKRSFLAGMLTMALIGGLGISALAASGQVAFNVSALSLNGTQVSAKGENYTLANGHSVPASITYTDETGGGTTYLPVRRISELLGVETGWDGAAGAVTVKGEVKAPTTPETPKTDYSTWTAEEEKAYQEFKGLWEITRTKITSDNEILYDAKYSGGFNKSEFTVYWASITDRDKVGFAKRLSQEYQLKNSTYIVALYFQYSNTDLGYAFCYENNRALASFSANPFNIHENIN